ncbi:hypothetical protein RBU61_13450 [Tissierella sp. MB52-C2]|uniref:hypothetical protein n=1 Tax=Tissierella sp. MB52-C2 TaxID=3070999 RepID=UPI00280BEBC0|nr:hypothetical protein [Tissierella sp. MB52-C2]WMM23923.1 hypothetical protein RBU61_13450 [Tissierella sp. MB52-C2]
MNISIDIKRILRSLGIMFIVALITYKLPHKSYSIIEYIIRPIKKGSSTFYISGFIPLILIIIATNDLSKIEKLKFRNSSIIFIAMLVIIMPLMRQSIDATRMAYHFLIDDGLSSIEILDTSTSTSLDIVDRSVKIDIKLKLKDYGKEPKKFEVRIHFPEEVREIINQEYYESERIHITYGSGKIRDIDEVIFLELKEEEARDKLFNYWRYGGKFEYELFNEEESIRIIEKDF